MSPQVHNGETVRLTLRGRLHILIEDAKTGEVLRDEYHDNKVVDVGLNLMRDLLGGGAKPPSHIAVGTDNTAPVAGDTILGTEVFRNLITRRVPSTAKITFQLFLATGDANGNTLVEAGLFNKAGTDAGTMLSRVTYAAITKTSAITATLTWDITIAEA